MGAVSEYQITLAWFANSFPGPLVERSAVIATANMIINTALIYRSYMWPDSSGLQYIPGVVAALVAVLAPIIRSVHVRVNRRLERKDGEGGYRYIL